MKMSRMYYTTESDSFACLGDSHNPNYWDDEHEDTPEGLKMIFEIEKFWGIKPGDRFAGLDFGNLNDIIKKVLLQGFFGRDSYNQIFFQVEGMWEMCKFLKVPYPKKEIDAFKRQSFSFERENARGPFAHLDEESRVELFKTTEKLVKDMIPYVFNCQKSLLEYARARAVWAIVLHESKRHKIWLAAFRAQQQQVNQ